MTEERGGEYRGKTVEAAITAGLAALRLSREEVAVEIVRQGSRGVLGIGAEDAVVRLTPLRASAGEKKAQRPAGSRAEGEPPAAKTPAAPASRQAVQADQAVQPGLIGEPEAARLAGAAPETATDDKLMSAAHTGREFLMGILERMNLRAEVEIVPQSDAEAGEGQRALVLNIIGDDLGVLIGRQNETLSALEFVTRLMVNQQTRTRTSFAVDVNGYRAKRAESLRRLAVRMAEQAMQTGRTVSLEPMPPAERRIIHLALQEHPSVTTQSIGEGDHRKVTIIPKRA